ncbi:MAG: hypothetical protein JXR58_10220 [Bacteroidales bacterium]|nr:hypothetical protein [Bacteroidales bacterium]
MDTRILIFVFVGMLTSVFAQKVSDEFDVFAKSKIITLNIEEKLDEDKARTIDLLLSARIKNVFFSVTNIQTNKCVLIVSEKFSEKFSCMDSINASFVKLTGFHANSFSSKDFSEDEYLSLYKTVKYFYENHKPLAEDAPKCYRTGNTDKDQLNYNLAYTIWKNKQPDNNTQP